MVFYGLERPVEYGRQLIFDPSTALMVLDAQKLYAAAVYNDYQQNLLEMKEFNKEFGNFMTPILADLEWWDLNVTGPVQHLINDAYNNGVDLLRNPQGRAMISQLIANRPYGLMAFKRQRAKNAEEYYKNMAALRLNDKYNEDFSKWLGEDPNQWDPNSVGVTSPTVFKTLKDATNDWYNNRTPRDLTPEEKKQLGLDPRYKYTGYFDSDLMNVAKGQTPGWQGTPISNYYRELAKRKLQANGIDNPTADQVEAVLQRDIANAQQEWLVGPTLGKADEFEVLKQELSNTLTAQKLDKSLDNYYKMIEAGADLDGNGLLSQKERQYYAMMKNAANGGYTYDPSTGNFVSPTGAPIEFTDYRRMGADDNRRKTIQQNAASYVLQMIAKELADIDAYNQALKENETGKRTTTGKTVTMAAGVPGAFTYRAGQQSTYTPSKTVDVPKHSKEEMAKLKKRASAAKFAIYMYQRYLNEDGSANYKKMMENGYFDALGNPTEMFMKEINKLNKANKYLPEDQRAQRAEDTYMLYAGSAPAYGTEEHKRLLTDFAGTKEESVPGLPNKMRKVTLNHYKLSAIHRGDATGANVYEQSSNARRALEWLRNNKIEAFVDDDTVNDAWIPNSRGTLINNDIYGEAIVDRRVIARMFDALGIKSEKALDELLGQLGIQEYEKQTTTPESKGSIDYKWATYYSIPITKTISNGIVQGDRNSLVNKAKYGEATAKERERNSYSAGIQSTLN